MHPDSLANVQGSSLASFSHIKIYGHYYVFLIVCDKNLISAHYLDFAVLIIDLVSL